MQGPEDFNGLSESEQETTTLNGTFLADREENGLVVQLFSLNTYYIERWYDPVANRILRHRAFAGTARLVPYIAHIKFNPR
jgi:hypothetical protein